MAGITVMRRMTRQRRVIMDTLHRINWHPTAEELYGVVRERAPRISLGTVYRNLDILTRERMIVMLAEAGDQRRYDGNTKPHFHVQCLGCGAISDVPESAVNWDQPIGATCPGFNVTGFRLVFEGYCDACRQ